MGYTFLINPENFNFEEQAANKIYAIKEFDLIKNSDGCFIVTDKKDILKKYGFSEENFSFIKDLSDNIITELLQNTPSKELTFLYAKKDLKTKEWLKKNCEAVLNEDLNSSQKAENFNPYFCLKGSSIFALSLKKKDKKSNAYILEKEEKFWSTYIKEEENFVEINGFKIFLSIDQRNRFRQMIRIRQPVLIFGERGSGKTTAVEKFVMTEMIKNYDIEDKKHFVSLACETLDTSIAEAELFGYAPGAFTDASHVGKTGKIEQANGGILYLDEIHDLSLPLQHKLIKCLEEHTFTPLGSNEEKYSDFFLICSTNKSKKEIQDFLAADFYDRINTFIVEMPSVEKCKNEFTKSSEAEKNGNLFIKEIFPAVWNNYKSKTKNHEFGNFTETFGNANSESLNKIIEALTENTLKGNFRDIEKLVAKIDLLVFDSQLNKFDASDFKKNIDKAIKEWEEEIQERNGNLEKKNVVQLEDKLSEIFSDDLIAGLKWDGMKNIFKNWFIKKALKKYKTQRGASAALGNTKNFYKADNENSEE